MDIMVTEADRTVVAEYLTKNGMSFSTMVENVQELINMSPIVKGSGNSKQGHNMDWDSYHPLEDMYSYLDFIEGIKLRNKSWAIYKTTEILNFPANFDYASTEVIGQSFEGTDMRLMKICKDGCGNKPAMWIDGGIHAREWIAHAAVMYMIKQLTEDVAGQEDLIDNLDWYILPCVNPDGYAWTQDPNGDRLWRKTRYLPLFL